MIDCMYARTFIESIIEQMLLWSVLEFSAHPHLVSTRSVQCTGEYFCFIECHAQKAATIVDSDSDTLLNDLAEAATDEAKKS